MRLTSEIGTGSTPRFVSTLAFAPRTNIADVPGFIGSPDDHAPLFEALQNFGRGMAIVIFPDGDDGFARLRLFQESSAGGILGTVMGGFENGSRLHVGHGF